MEKSGPGAEGDTKMYSSSHFNLDAKLQTMFQSMSLIQRNVRGSEAEKEHLRHRFTAMRVWNGLSSLFFV